jgi:peptide deformylase
MSDIITIDTAQAVTTSKQNTIEPFPLVSEEELSKYDNNTKEFDFTTSDAKEFADRLKQTAMLHRAFGVAAPQCGFPLRVFAFGAETEYQVMFNPVILNRSEETTIMEEGCLSFPFLVLNVVRPKEVTVKFQNELGEEKTLTFSGISSKIIQHEFDHLDGITFKERTKPLALKTGLKRREKQIKKFAQQIMSQRIMKGEK